MKRKDTRRHDRKQGNRCYPASVHSLKPCGSRPTAEHRTSNKFAEVPAGPPTRDTAISAKAVGARAVALESSVSVI